MNSSSGSSWTSKTPAAMNLASAAPPEPGGRAGYLAAARFSLIAWVSA
jgi:hypothetical protein